ncbi:sialidase family protein [Kutzneria buriramensis]|uniref:BNR repeat protein n=1 Tax=Kutzneria buriramensis TaxID=1045776 RepID=A0A3E0H7D7_9PSEU|nr:sialidase family protein [Kutzneria buriramensis]REH39177.1 BNR repeat protein [Kutzneria buriramensis]
MSRSIRSRVLTLAVAALASLTAFTTPATAARAAVSLNQVSTDPYSDAQAQHSTEVEPDTFSFGNTIVGTFQVGRVTGGGASNIGWTTSTDGGQTWARGFLPGTTANTGGPYGQVSDASVAYDAKDNVWMISWLGIAASGAVDVELSRSTDAKTWGNPVAVSATGTFFDKNWTVCDDHPASPFYGHCYTEYDDANAGDAEHMRTSTDGGLTWGSQLSPADNPSGLGGQPVVQPNGTVVVPFSSASANAERSFVSTNGGASWGSSVQIATVSHHPVAGLEDNDFGPLDTLRESPLPSAEIDSAGKVYVVWADCRFRSGCPSNDIIMSTSTNGTSWSAPARLPIDAATSTADHFTPGIGVDPSSSGGTARIGVTYYYYPQANCTDTTCQLNAAFVSSADGGTTWSAPTQLAGPMTLAWLPNTSQGRMFGDYISTSVLAGGNAVTVIPVAHAPSGSTFDVGMYATIGGLPIGGGNGGNTVTVTNPGNQTGTVGTATSLQIAASDSASGQTLTYSATGLPAGLSINSGTGLISGTPTTAGTGTVTVTATDTTNASGSATFTWTINPVGGGCPSPGQKLGNPGFESGNTTWTATPAVIGQNGPSEPARTGSWDAWLDGYGSTHTDTLTQSVTIPAGCHASLSFWLHIDTAETTTTTQVDKLTVKAGTTTLATFSNLNKNTGYAQQTFDVSSLAGQTVTISFSGTENNSRQTSFVIDDTALTAS